MLSFYLLPDATPAPSPARLSELPKAGEMSAEDFEQLQAERIIEGRLDYDADFRWSSGIVNMKLQLLLHRYPQLRPNATTDGAEQRLFLILLNASAASSGLLAVAD